MTFRNIIPDKSISLFVKNILCFKETENNQPAALPFFADGYPGLVFYESSKVMKIMPHKKPMSPFFLYGQTLNPVELKFEDNYTMIVFQFYPFMLKSLFGVTPKLLNDGCYDLLDPIDADNVKCLNQLQQNIELGSRITILSKFLYAIFQRKSNSLDLELKQAIQSIIDKKGQLVIKTLCNELRLNTRTFERRFLAETGLTPKQFAKIIQFQSSHEQLAEKDFSKLTDIVYENGFADQSHFIKVFKAFTGKTPKNFLKGLGLSFLFYLLH